jgi:hypothetical protein
MTNCQVRVVMSVSLVEGSPLDMAPLRVISKAIPLILPREMDWRSELTRLTDKGQDLSAGELKEITSLWMHPFPQYRDYRGDTD